MKNRLRLRAALLTFLACLTFLFSAVPVNATLLIMPIRIVFKDKDRMSNITLVNTGDKEAVYQMGWRYQKQLENGSYEVLKEPLDQFQDLSKIVLYSPRQVVLPASGKQRIRLSLRRPPDMAEGEYRAHLQLLKLGNGETTKTPELEKGKLALALNMNVGYSLPVIIRHGAYDTTVTIHDPKFNQQGYQGKPQLDFMLKRGGKFSSFGVIKIFWSAGGAEEKQIGIMNNVNVFPEISQRTVSVPLSETAISGGTIRIMYIGDGPDKGITFDEVTFPVGG